MCSVVAGFCLIALFCKHDGVKRVYNKRRVHVGEHNLFCLYRTRIESLYMGQASARCRLGQAASARLREMVFRWGRKLKHVVCQP